MDSSLSNLETTPAGPTLATIPVKLRARIFAYVGVVSIAATDCDQPQPFWPHGARFSHEQQDLFTLMAVNRQFRAEILGNWVEKFAAIRRVFFHSEEIYAFLSRVPEYIKSATARIELQFCYIDFVHFFGVRLDRKTPQSMTAFRRWARERLPGLKEITLSFSRCGDERLLGFDVFGCYSAIQSHITTWVAMTPETVDIDIQFSGEFRKGLFAVRYEARATIIQRINAPMKAWELRFKAPRILHPELDWDNIRL